MKKKILTAVIAVMLTAALVACGNKDTSELKYLKDFKAEKFVDPGDYKNVEVELAQPEVTDEYLDQYIEYILMNSPVSTPVTDRPAQLGDVANIDYEGKLNGVAFEGGTAQGTNLSLGSGQFIEGFEDGVVGMEIGETKDLELTFPDPYDNNPDLAGKAVIFTVTLNSLSKQETPELTDEYVASLGLEECKTVEEYRNYMYEGLLEQETAQFEQEKVNAAISKLEEGAKIKAVPEGMVTRMSDTLIANISSYAQVYGMEIGDYVATVYGGTAEEYEATLREQARLMAQRYIMLAVIAENEGIAVTDEELNEQLALEAENYGYSTEEYTEGMDKEAYREYLLVEKVMEYLGENVTVNSEAVQ